MLGVHCKQIITLHSLRVKVVIHKVYLLNGKQQQICISLTLAGIVN